MMKVVMYHEIKATLDSFVNILNLNKMKYSTSAVVSIANDTMYYI